MAHFNWYSISVIPLISERGFSTRPPGNLTSSLSHSSMKESSFFVFLGSELSSPAIGQIAPPRHDVLGYTLITSPHTSPVLPWIFSSHLCCQILCPSAFVPQDLYLLMHPSAFPRPHCFPTLEGEFFFRIIRPSLSISGLNWPRKLPPLLRPCIEFKLMPTPGCKLGIPLRNPSVSMGCPPSLSAIPILHLAILSPSPSFGRKSDCHQVLLFIKSCGHCTPRYVENFLEQLSIPGFYRHQKIRDPLRHFDISIFSRKFLGSW